MSGGRDWTAAAAREAVAALAQAAGPHPAVWLTDRTIATTAVGAGYRPEPKPLVLPLASGTRLTGTETELLIYDAWSGLDPDGFGAATGALRGGGLLLLLTPPLEAWPDLPDPQAARIAVWPHEAESLERRFQRRFARVLLNAAGVTLVCEGAPLPSTPAARASSVADSRPPMAEPDPGTPATPDQRAAIEAILHLARGRAHRPLVLTAHRGRGKSAALGMAAARLVAAGCRSILVTAPRLDACESLFRHFDLTRAALADPAAPSLDPAGSVRFLAPDDLCQNRPQADLLLVDEAAGIPAPLLASLLDHYPRLCFATTVHGYEGTGRGFEVRFREVLDRRTPLWRRLSLEDPIRWSAGDPLEALVFRALLLDASPAELEPSRRARLMDATELVRLDRDALTENESTLRQIFGLLVLAHYQTRPLDLRMLLDGPNIRVYCLRQGAQVLATLLAAEEGGVESEELRQAIFRGDRRPRGHLLPQTLSAHWGLPEAPALRYLRVVRIAVHPALTRQGLGTRLLRGLALDGHRGPFDLAGA
ncbi:MAG: GNAT family N-acetyltransferase, partial [Bdellovibrio bacteriovorus]